MTLALQDCVMEGLVSASKPDFIALDIDEINLDWQVYGQASYQLPGKYCVNVTVSDGYDDNYYTYTFIIINEPPQPLFTYLEI